MAGKEAVVFLVDCNGESSLPAASPLWGGPVFESYFRLRHMNRGVGLAVAISQRPLANCSADLCSGRKTVFVSSPPAVQTCADIRAGLGVLEGETLLCKQHTI